ncbi:MAG TPA: carboxypeptidase-like regulatory domain-containing protein, partial [Gammaproteobacteria bacterium]
MPRPFTVSCLATLLAACGGSGGEPSATASTVAIDNDDIGGTVNGPAGPEAGVWVIAETSDLPTRYAKIVVTDDQGRYVVPDLPSANYQVWVRGYGLVDSTKVAARPGQKLDLVANAAPTPGAAAVVYPAAYWYSMMKVPTADEVSFLPGGVNQYLASVKNLSCIGCHQIGQLATRTIPTAFSSMSHHDAWVRRIQSGQAGSQMLASAMNQLGGVPPKYLGEWTERVANGELPHATP